jgi:hypothetical protein
VEAIMSAPISSGQVRGALTYAPKWARQRQATEMDPACTAAEWAVEDATPYIPVAKSATEQNPAAEAERAAVQDIVPKSATEKNATLKSAKKSAATKGAASDKPWWRGKPSMFEGDMALLELRERLKLAPDQIPEPSRRPARANPLAPIWRFAVVAGMAASAWGCYNLWAAREQTGAPQTQSVSIERPSAGSAQAAMVLPSTADPAQLAAVPQAPVPTLRPIEPLAWPASQGNDVASGDIAIGAGPTNRASSPWPADAKATVVLNSPARGVDPAPANTATRDASAAEKPATGVTATKNPSVVIAAPSSAGGAHAPELAAAPTPRQPAMDAKESEALLARAQSYLMAGDVAAARLVLRRAAEAGVAKAALVLGDTFDPQMLKQLGVVGTVGDSDEARGWYRRAAELGSIDAPQRLLADNRGQFAEGR